MSEGRSRSKGTGDDDIIATQQQHHVWRRNTYTEHLLHGRHRAHVPVANGLIEAIGSLQRSEGRAAVSSEQRSRSEGIGNGRRRRSHSYARSCIAVTSSCSRAATRGMEEHVH